MRKQWLIGGIAALVPAGRAGVAGFASKGGDTAKKSDDKGDKAVALEFLANEITQPTLAAMPAQIEFSGPLVAPGTVMVRAKATGTLVTLNVGEGSRVHAGQVL